LAERNVGAIPLNNPLLPGTHCEVDLPVRLSVGTTTLVIEPATGDRLGLHPAEAGAASGRSWNGLNRSLDPLPAGGPPPAAMLARWFEAVLALQRSTAGSPVFYEQAARSLVDLVGLDRGLVVLRRGDNWEIAGRSTTKGAFGRDYSLTLLRRVVEDRRTIYQSSATLPTTESLLGVDAVVVAPIFDPRDQVVGVLYGSRNELTGRRIGPWEVEVVQLLASAVGAGLARLEQEAEATRLRSQFEQFFSAHLAQELQRNPRLLEGQEREVTVLFCDMHGFSRLAERLGPRTTCRLVADVMERVTARIREFDGLVVDYYGDGLLAMWNAPVEQPDHAALACRAALAVRADLPGLADEWRELGRGSLKLGIGLNTGPALVGNTGSRHKLKYGPIGHSVNLACRVEGTTKSFGVPVLITGSTRARLAGTFATRRLGRVRFAGVNGAVDLYELHAEGAAPEWLARRDTYEAALSLFEAGQWNASCRAVYPLLTDPGGQDDLPCITLAARALECLKAPPKTFDPVVEVNGK
jgi:adenylate cyclase